MGKDMHEKWYEGQYDDLGNGAMKSVQCPVKARHSSYCSVTGLRLAMKRLSV